MLLPLDQLPAQFQNIVPAKRLPPDFGTRFIVGPPMSVSPIPPATLTVTSSTLFESYANEETPPPLNAAATVMPLIAMRPSLVLPPRAVKNVMVGVFARPLLSTVRPGIALRIEPYA